MYQVNLQHLRTMPWQPRAVVIANRLAEVVTPWVADERRENQRQDLAGPLLSCADDLPEGLRAQVAEHTGANPVGAKPLMLKPLPQELITSTIQAIERARAVAGSLADPVRIEDIGPAYRVESGGQPDNVYFVHNSGTRSPPSRTADAPSTNIEPDTTSSHPNPDDPDEPTVTG